ncbi:MAG: hypothetical protein HN413_15375 [Chloroflexi bacterium]|jgi:hypothetical protein|nr:hypothetical protein [Chloroflexota bacterium]
MEDNIRAAGQTSVVLVLNMKRFIAPEDQARFEELRGSPELVRVLQKNWPAQLQQGYAFRPAKPNEILDPHDNQAVARMSPEEIGFVTGIFRQIMLEDYSPPEYSVIKEHIRFPEPIWENLQFKKLFREIWFNWEISVRPTMTGMFIIKLKQSYPTPTPILQIASDVLGLQMSFDIPGALNWMEKLQKVYANDQLALQEKEASVKEFLKWLGGNHNHSIPDAYVDYAPVQWQLAMEICRRFVQEIGLNIPFGQNGPVKLQVPDPQLSPPLHDAYVIYRFNELTAPGNALKKKGGGKNHILVSPSDIQNSRFVRRGLAQLIEGSILKNQRNDSPNGSERRFARPRKTQIDALMDTDKASWVDELCLLTARSTIIMPSRKARNDELFISTLPAATSQVNYLWYWEAIERLLEFVIEVRVLVQLVERNSATLMQEFVRMLRHTRTSLLDGDLEINRDVLIQLSNRAANLSRLSGLGQGLSNPQLWGRAEFAVEKASYLFQRLGVPLLLQHTERNVNHINDLINHVDELYLASISERSNRQSFWVSAGLAGVSLAFILYTLPSFWIDLNETIKSFSPDTTDGIFKIPVPWEAILKLINWIGIIGAPIVLALALGIIFWSIREAARVRQLRRSRKSS